MNNFCIYGHNYYMKNDKIDSKTLREKNGKNLIVHILE